MTMQEADATRNNMILSDQPFPDRLGHRARIPIHVQLGVDAAQVVDHGLCPVLLLLRKIFDPDISKSCSVAVVLQGDVTGTGGAV